MFASRRSAAVILMAALMPSIGVQCVAGQYTPAAQMACCTGAKHDCDGSAAVADCCQTDRAQQAQPFKKADPVLPPLVAIASHVPALIRPAPTSVRADDRVPLTAVSPPKYVLLASFLI
ncbi:MAG: hypothetical protein HY655_10595 [Acidobacteria bacterium]|nr:hypothetical protein [Acidobacteriota bacterium]